MKVKRRIWPASLLLIALAVAVGCSSAGTAPSGNSSNQSPGTSAPAPTPKDLTIALSADPPTLDPQVAFDAVTGAVTMNIFDPLIKTSADGSQLEPMLAESWKQEAPTVWEFKLRKGVTFHNGEPFNASVVVANVARARMTDLQPPPRMGLYYTTIKEVQVVDDYTIKIHTTGPDPILPRRLTDYFGVMLPKQYLADKGHAIIGNVPVGTGPYKFKEWVKGTKIVLEANPNYWRGTPTYANVTFVPVKEVAARIAMIEAGQADLIVDVPVEHVNRLKQNNKLKIYALPSARNIHVVLNTVNGGPFANLALRKAVNLAVNKQVMVDSIFEGNAKAIRSLFLPESWGYDPKAPVYATNPSQSKALLNGNVQVTLDVPAGRYPKIEDVAEVVKQQLKEVGVEVKLNPMEWGVFNDKWMKHTLSDMFLIGAGDSMLDADQLSTSRLISNAPYGGYYKSKAMDDLIIKARTETDEAKRMGLYAEIQKMIYDDAIIIPLYQQYSIYAVKSDVKFVPYFTEKIQLFDFKP